MSEGIKTKITFGGCDIDHIRPAPSPATPPALNIVIGFEDALKLHLSLGQALARLNSYKRSTSAGKRTAVNLCVFPGKGRITVNEGRVRASGLRPVPASNGIGDAQ
jgi:hypothetical protein